MKSRPPYLRGSKKRSEVREEKNGRGRRKSGTKNTIKRKKVQVRSKRRRMKVLGKHESQWCDRVTRRSIMAKAKKAAKPAPKKPVKK